MSFNKFDNPSDYAEDVIALVAKYLSDKGISHDTGDNCIYFNDKVTKETYRIQLEKCEYYEGED